MILAPLAAFLVWEVITRSLAAYLADASPEAAIRLWSTNPTALVNLADLRLNSALEPRQQLIVTRPTLLARRNNRASILPQAIKVVTLNDRPEISWTGRDWVRNKCSNPILG